jgi:hypothetical protein
LRADRHQETKPASARLAGELSSDRLLRLLKTGTDEAQEADTSDDSRKANILLERLAGTVPWNEIQASDTARVMARIPTHLLPLGGHSLGDVLLDQDTSLETLNVLKDACKQVVAHKEPEWRYAVAITLYYAAIASALRFHARKITTHSPEALRKAFDDLGRKPWMAPELVIHFKAAIGFCREKDPEHRTRKKPE